MFLLEPGHTPYDWHFRLFGIDVRVHPMFWLVGAIMGFRILDQPNGLGLFAIWMVCMFVSILIHEMGHVVMGQLFGSYGHIVLYSFGGLAVGSNRLHDRWQRIAVSFAGPLAGFLLVGLVSAGLVLMGMDYFLAVVQRVLRFVDGPELYSTEALLLLNPFIRATILDLIWINLFWGLVNLLPIWPLDGGQISRDFLEGAQPGGQGTRTSLGISLVLASIVAINSIVSDRGVKLVPFLPGLGLYGALMFGMLAVQSFQLLQQERNPPWRREEW